MYRGLATFTSCFRRDERGVSSVVFSILLTALLLISALAIDYGRMVTETFREQRALDAAVLAASDLLGTPEQDVEGPRMAKAFYAANRKPGDSSTLTNLTIDKDKGELNATAGTDLAMTLLRVFGLKSLDMSVSTRVAKGNGTVEIALALDNSGSMSADMGALKQSAINLLNQVFAGAEGTDKVRVGLVPFAASVNVGAQYAGANWMDTEKRSSIHMQNFKEDKSRFDLFAEMSAGWGGCVEARPAPYDTNDASPTDAIGDTYFVPMFAPDEPGEAGSALSGYNNSYLDDDGGTCPPYDKVCTGGYTKRGTCRSWTVTRLPNREAQARTCKYSGQSPSGGTGPNRSCTTQPILPLTSSRSSIENAVNSMISSGNTNISEGVMWGWRVLSPGDPFTQGRPYSNEENSKYLVIMSDGENTYGTASNHNLTTYSAFGYAAPFRPEPASRLGSNTSQLVANMNAKTIAACNNAKAAGITIFSIAFRDAAASPSARAVLAGCASEPSKALVATDGQGLAQAFQTIGKEISKLRIAG